MKTEMKLFFHSFYSVELVLHMQSCHVMRTVMMSQSVKDYHLTRQSTYYKGGRWRMVDGGWQLG